MPDTIDVYVLSFAEAEAVRYYSPNLEKGVAFRKFDGLGGNRPPRYIPFDSEDREIMIKAINNNGKTGSTQGIIKKTKMNKQKFENFVDATKEEMARWTLYELSLKTALRLEEKIRSLKPGTL